MDRARFILCWSKVDEQMAIVPMNYEAVVAQLKGQIVKGCMDEDFFKSRVYDFFSTKDEKMALQIIELGEQIPSTVISRKIQRL